MNEGTEKLLEHMKEIAPWVQPGSAAHARLLGVAAVLVAGERGEVMPDLEDLARELEGIERLAAAAGQWQH